jgi:hypothetical protein
VAHTTVPPTSLTWPSIVTLVPPELDAALDDAELELLDADDDALDDEPDEELPPDEQPARPATTTATPPTATSKFCFTTVLLCPCDPSRSTDRQPQYGVPPTCGLGIGRIRFGKNALR